MDIIDSLMNDLLGFSNEQITELRGKLEAKWNVKAEVISTPAPITDTPITKVEQTEFSVFLTGFGNSKMSVIKTMRELTGISLLEAKSLVERATTETPQEIKSGISKDAADEVKNKIETNGGAVIIK
jgi:large subunit ribosomal protein L7/L12